MKNHIELALYAAADGGVGNEVLFLLAGDIFFILHSEKNDLVTVSI